VIVADDRVVGRGWTQPGGRPHAEAQALAQGGAAAKGAIAYVTLEPCAHESPRGPACADLLIAAGISRAVIAVRDPDPRTNGAGAARLRAAGIDVVEDAAPCEGRAVAPGFFTRQLRGRPHVTLKLALSLDGGMAMADGRSRWITGDAARAHAHVERACAELILVGRGTLAIDLPRLDVRVAGLEARSPRPVLLSRSAAGVPDGWLHLAAPHGVCDLPGDHLLVEGGAGAAAAFLAADLVDRLLLYRAPILIGGARTLGDIGLDDFADAHGRWRLDDARMLGSDRVEVYERRRE
jgi:diaminohydroxyphosphoribosylaminopyrimidine deaminase/5-amino-6-(5-phosphoribosylamino)uracil reductase